MFARCCQAMALLALILTAFRANAAPSGGKEIFLDERKRLDWSATHPTAVILLNDNGSSVWKNCLAPRAGRGKVRTNVVEVYLHPGDGSRFPACDVQGKVPKACIEQIGEGLEKADLALVIKRQELDSAISIPMAMGMGGVGGSVPSSHLEYTRSGEIFLVEISSSRTLYHARLSGSAATLEGAEADLCREITEGVSEVFDPDLGRNFPRTRIGVNPVGLLLAADGNLFLQGVYERLLGNGHLALHWAPAYLDYTKNERDINYLYLPALGLRWYTQIEGQGWWFGSKVGYARLEDAYYEDTSVMHAAFLMAEVGHAWRLNRLYFFLNLGAGPAAGWKKEGWRRYSYYNTTPPEDLKTGFAVQPIFEAAGGVGYAF